MKKSIFSKGPVCPRPPIPTEQPENAMVVRVLWNGIVQKAEEIPLDNTGTANFVIGEDPSCDFLVPRTHIGGQEKFELAIVTGGALTVFQLPNMAFSVASESDDIVSLHNPTPSARTTEADSHFVQPRQIGVISLGPWSFEMTLERRSAPIKSPITVDKRTGYFFGFSFILHAVFLFVFYLVPPEAAGFSFDASAETNRYVKVMLGVQEAVVQTQQDLPTETGPEAAGGQAHAGESGEMGDRHAERTNNRSALKGPPNNTNPHMKKEDLKATAADAGVLAFLSAQKMPVSPFGLDTSIGFDPENALGALQGNDFGPNMGYGGLGLHGTGRGGGGDGKNTIGDNTFGRRIAWTRLRGTCTGPHCGTIGTGRGRTGPKRGIKVGLKTDAKVFGALSKETIRRIIRRHVNEIKFCYEKGLRKRPDLAGRISVKFLIEPTGGVKTATVANSTTGDLSVDQCIAQAFRRMTFPMPEQSGLVIVTYPFTLTSSEG